MRKQYIIVVITLLAAGILLFSGAEAAEFDPDRYTYDELIEIRQQIDERLAEIEKQNALANADRSIQFDLAEMVIFLRRSEEQQPKVTILKEGAPERTQFDWNSSNPEIASVAPNGKVTAESAGDAVITATAKDNPYLSASYTVHAAAQVEKITLWGPTEPLVLGEDAENAGAVLAFSIEPEDAYYQEVRWVSSNEAVVTVDENGKVQALQPGTAVITAVSTEETPAGRAIPEAAYELTVIQSVTSIECEQNELSLSVGETVTLKTSVMPENASNKAVTYSSSDPEVAEVNKQGNVTAKACGECDILCEAADGYGASRTVHVTVSKLVTGLKFAEESIHMVIGETRKLEVEIMPEDATKQDLIWTSTNVFVARVAAGTVEAVGQGDCEITCTTMDGSRISASIRIHIPSFGVEKEEYTVTEKEGLEIAVTRNQKDCEIIMETEGDCFTATWKGQDALLIQPVEAGEGFIVLENPSVSADTVRIHIIIENDAVFNLESYPAVAYTELVTAPGAYEGQQISLYGKIWGIIPDGDAYSFNIGTAGEAYNDQVMWVKCPAGLMPEGMKDGSMVTLYGLFRMEQVYSEALKAETTVPALDAEKILMDARNEE